MKGKANAILPKWEKSHTLDKRKLLQEIAVQNHFVLKDETKM